MIKKNSKKQNIIKRLKGVYCRLKPSKLHGVGIFAIIDIPAKTNPFNGLKKQKWHLFHTDELANLHPEVNQMIDDLYVIEKNKTVYIPENGPNGADISFFINHSKKPNVKTIDEGQTFITLRKIKKGEELTIDYGTYDHKY